MPASIALRPMLVPHASTHRAAVVPLALAVMPPSPPPLPHKHAHTPLLTHIPLLWCMRPHAQGARRAMGRLGRFEVFPQLPRKHTHILFLTPTCLPRLLCTTCVHTQGARRATGRLGRFEVIDEDEDAEVDEDEEDADGKKKGKKGKKGALVQQGLLGLGLCRAG